MPVSCERHFEPCFIEGTFKNVIQGEVIEIPRNLPQLVKDAVPTVFPDAPRYLSKPVPQKRRERNLCDQTTPLLPAKHWCTDAKINGDNLFTNDTFCNAAVICEFSELQASSPGTKVDLLDTSDQTTFAHCHISSDCTLDRLHMSRRVVLNFSVSGEVIVKATLYIQRKKLKDQYIKTTKKADDLLQEIGNLKLCPSRGLKPTSKSLNDFNECHFSINTHCLKKKKKKER